MSNFFTEPKTLAIKDKVITVTPLPVKNISRAAKAAAPLITALSEAKIDPVIVLENADSVISLCSIATNEPIDWVGELNVAELTDVLSIVIEVNAGFFTQMALPKIQAMVAKVGQIAKESQTVGTTA